MNSCNSPEGASLRNNSLGSLLLPKAFLSFSYPPSSWSMPCFSKKPMAICKLLPGPGSQPQPSAVGHFVNRRCHHPCCITAATLKKPTVCQTTKAFLRKLSRNKMISFSAPSCCASSHLAAVKSRQVGCLQHRELPGLVHRDFGA